MHGPLTDRRLRSDERPTLAIVAAWLFVSCLLLGMTFSNIVSGVSPDPDDLLRLVQVRDLLGGQGWFDLHQYRISPPEGVLMHWSRIVDVPLALLIVALTPIFGASVAETITLAIVPLLLLGMFMAVVGRLAWRFFGTEGAAFACLSLGLYPLVLMQIQPMRIDHHAYQILALLVAVWALSWRSMKHSGIVAGIALGTGLSVSIELLPMTAVIGLVFFFRWMRDARDRFGLVAFLNALAASMTVLFLLTRGIGDLASHCDVITPSHLGFFILAALSTTLIASKPAIAPLKAAAALAITGAVGLALFAAASPVCVGSPFGNLDPLVKEHWYLNVFEGRPIWVYPWSFWVPQILQVVIALGASAALVLTNKAWLRVWWAEYTFILLAAIIGGVVTTRSLAFAGAIAAIPLGWLAMRLLGWWTGSRKIAVKIVGPVAIAFLLLPSLFVQASEVGKIGEDGSDDDTAAAGTETSCNLHETLPELNALPPALIFAPIDIGPDLLLRTHHSVVATGHHRAQAGMHDIIATFMGGPEDAQRTVAAHRAEYVVFCKNLPEPQLYEKQNEDGLAARLRADDTPNWLTPMPQYSSELLKVYRVAN
ncbi:hypothetical protein [Qipengyuania atrilutea]|uniref:Glycosyltransferase RgtA/B/C/D-like domain-containing protein n=1 Tax=Qipengyuania atrilutea TaxID=2744473 RepID=A0A850GY79_9SPHN|nr:hypothetical protein [Actirhodobacter atriluteus]NVD44574.1 hypothetical protein [Actirhodobacter atriluteus]